MTSTGVWWTCDGNGNEKRAGGSSDDTRPMRSSLVTRRSLVGGAMTSALAAWAGRSALADVTLTGKQDEAGKGDVIITVFLRGGMDGLSLIVPHGDDDYYRARPTLALAAPKKGSGSVTDLDGFFGMHPSAAAALVPHFQEGRLAAVQAIGSSDQTRSHFEAMSAMERGLKGGGPDYASGEASGWMARYLNATPPADPSPLRAVAFSHVMPDTLRGATDTSVLSTLAEYQLNAPETEAGRRYVASLHALYEKGADPASVSGREIQRVLKTLRSVDPANYKPANGALYPETHLGGGLRQVAILIKANVGLEAAFLDREGWDTHVAQGGATGYLALGFQDVADSLAAFAKDMGQEGLTGVTVIVQTEFGRRVRENSGLGTDHGRGSAMLLLGGSVNGGKVYGTWPGLALKTLEGPGDLRVTTDYRTVFAEVLSRRTPRGEKSLAAIFPGWQKVPALGVVRQA